MKVIRTLAVLTAIMLLGTGTVLYSQISSAVAKENDSQNRPVILLWGVPDRIEMTTFAGLERSIEAEEIKEGEGPHDVKVLWQKGGAYIVPIFAYSEHILSGVRYFGKDIPSSFSLEWLDPWNREWYPLDKIPSQKIHLIKETQNREALNGRYTINFGPPEGAAFSKEKVRFIWFRVTPEKTGNYNISLFGFLESDDNHKQQVSNRLVLEAEISE